MGTNFATNNDNRDTFELIRENRWFNLNFGSGQSSRRHSSDDYNDFFINKNKFDDDDLLPSCIDFKHDVTTDGQDQDNTNYFMHPFQTSIDDTSLPPPKATPEITDNNITKSHWERTMDKLRLISSIQQQGEPTTQLDTTATTIVTSSSALVPYYPPAFDPIFIAFSRDEHGNKLPPILLQCLNVSVTDSEYLDGMGQWAFRIELQYGDVKWVIYRTIAEFVMLHYMLRFKSSVSDYVPAPPTFPNQLQSLYDSAKTTIGWDRKEDEDDDQDQIQQQQNMDINDENEKQRDALDRRIALTTYLRDLFKRAHMQISYDVCEFLELSAISMVQDMGWKGKEGYLQHRINFVNPRCCQFWTSRAWNTEWVLLRDSYIAFCENISSDTPTDVLMLDKGFTMTSSEPNLLGHYHLTLTNQTRRIRLKGSKREMDEWWNNIKKVQNESPWVRNHRFGSFAPVRHNAKVKWFVDAENHFNAVAEAILSAKSEIYIADWWLSPELYLRRPPAQNEEFRLDRLLQRKAREGVMIYIVVYKEMSLALTIDSAHTKQWLQSLHPNIMVQRHPDHASMDNNVLFWSHHEKIVVVDNRLAFIGGLDLCFGRYDSHEHSLSDWVPDDPDQEIFPGQDYSNPRKKDFVNVAHHDLTLVDRQVIPRMPWHDVTLATVGPMARDIARHFIQRWNYLKATKSMHRQNLPFLLPKGEYVAARDESKFKGTCRVQALRSSAQWSSGVEREHSIYNAYMECINQAKHFIYIENQFFISATDQDKLLRNKIAQALVERIIRAHEEKEKFKVFIIIPLVPAFEGDLADSGSSAKSVMHFQYTSISRGGNSIIERLERAGINPSDYIDWYSLRNWGRIQQTRRQQDHQPTENNDIRKDGSHSEENNTPFHSTFVAEASATTDDHDNDTPLDDQQSSEIHIPLKKDDDQVSRDDDDNSEYDDADQYVSELLYIHDKIMIVDDRLALIGSANINDRSQLGNRDSEIAMVIEDTEMVGSYMDGKKYKAAKFAHTLRLQLWKEHLGLLDFDDWSSLLANDKDHNSDIVNHLDVTSATQQQNMDHHHRHHHHHRHKHHHSHRHYHHQTQKDNDKDIQFCEAEEPVRMIDRLSRTRSLYDTFKAPNQGKDSNDEQQRLDAMALDPLSDQCYYNVWRKTAESNTLIYRRLFHCVPDDTIHTYEQHRRFTGMNMSDNSTETPSATSLFTAYGHVADPLLSGQEIREELETIQGHLVQFPVNYLKDENMIGSNNIIDSVTPMVIFT
ncbi:uncharacterized protein BX664DRAFT_292887 [Halteromyces radiatus]|uniref:uncharacterized protein n=1 Tax=Halteromyces radiatus TaxID=101107 RepID=UPI00221F2BC9|nr:uncharacterized protein BX664DRAFT_292887 [Halteromyces radiatus]KAI8097388.1 hypothetical protein BX664DRAFT_292887 [Halteromyces radiatus]